MTKLLLPPPDAAVALIRSGDDGLTAHGAFERFSLPFDGDAREGDLFLISRQARRAQPIAKVGRPSSVRAVIDALAHFHGEHVHTPPLQAEARRVAGEGERFARRNLTALPTFTIDSESTRDFDDAISARAERGARIRVWVHVADVAAFVRPGSPLDRDAARRATSVYLPTLTVPMLPEALSTGVCSLVPGKVRAAVTAEFLLKDGQVLERSFYRSKIRSIARLTYTEVDEIFLGQREPGPTYKAALAAARQAAVDRTVDDVVERSGESRFVFDDDRGEVVGLADAASESESHRLIERLMVLANQEVAAFLAARQAPALYRTHAQTSPAKLQALLGRLQAMGVTVDEPTLAGAAGAVDEHEARHGSAPALRALLMGARSAAAYQRELDSHEGLGLAAYTHFTSPIRRYADLLVHRALLAEIGAEPHTTAPTYLALPKIAAHLTERTLATKRLERRARAICSVSLLRVRIRDHGLGRTHTGTITGIGDSGVYVRVDCVEGMLGARHLGGSPDEHRTVWNARQRPLRLGARVRVRIRQIDPVKGQVALALA